MQNFTIVFEKFKYYLLTAIVVLFASTIYAEGIPKVSPNATHITVCSHDPGMNKVLYCFYGSSKGNSCFLEDQILLTSTIVFNV
ncbi:hypothetical protein [Flavobacterium sp. 7A]|uniref:hypothetical protein n=1 Tax=Flavobacterium sp. 7A TaxID=2940571 RepID=UPI002226D018|nr:hypothetical protein [Flavobacterium sp. 7A]MCW2119202.1 hypothetical protein [Flavobacterium sp. 7A]